VIEIDYPSIIKKAHWSDLLLVLGEYGEDQYQFALSHTYQQFWETCPRGEWLLHWIAKEKSTPHKQIVYAACQCARLALPYCTDKQQRPLKAIETTEKWIRGAATIEEVKQAGYAAWNFSTAATYAAYTAYYAYSYIHGPSAAYCASIAAGKSEADQQSTQLQSANLVRSLIPRPTKNVEEFERVLKLRAFL
jgi:hypothetical protein